MNHAYDEGYRAFLAGQTQDDNPYQWYQGSYVWWQWGWVDAERINARKEQLDCKRV